MTVMLKIIDEAPGAPRRLVREMRLVSERVSVRELMRRRIEEEVADINAGGSECAPLVMPKTWAGRPAAGMRNRDKVDAGQQLVAATEAFAKGRIIVIVGERQVSDLDAPLTLAPDTEVTFLKLVPLVGG